MKATFNVKVIIDNQNVTVKVDDMTIADMEIVLMQNVLKTLNNVERSVKGTVSRYYESADGSQDPSDENGIKNPDEQDIVPAEESLEA